MTNLVSKVKITFTGGINYLYLMFERIENESEPSDQNKTSDDSPSFKPPSEHTFKLVWGVNQVIMQRGDGLLPMD